MRNRSSYFKQLAGGALVLALLSFGVEGTAKTKPDLSGTWELRCLNDYKNIVSVMDPNLVPDSLANGFEVRDGRAFLTGTPTVPWLSIYNADLKPIYHALGYNSRSDALWKLVTDTNAATKFAPALYDIEPFTGVRAVDLPEADFTFVEYYASWCPNCKLQSNALKDFKKSHPEMHIAHVRINADTAKMQKKKYTRKSCPVKT